MRGLLRNKRKFWYCLFLDTNKPVDPEPEPEPEPDPDPVDPEDPEDPTEPVTQDGDETQTEPDVQDGDDTEPSSGDAEGGDDTEPSSDDTEDDDPPEENRILDEDGYETGEIISRYAAPVQMKAMISSATGQIRTEPFGTYEDYDRIIVTAWTDCPIDENTVLFVDKEPEFVDITNYEDESGEETLTPVTYRQPVYDYRVTRVSRGVNGARIYIRKVVVT